jgi:hypothetical protein
LLENAHWTHFLFANFYFIFYRFYNKVRAEILEMSGQGYPEIADVDYILVSKLDPETVDSASESVISRGDINTIIENDNDKEGKAVIGVILCTIYAAISLSILY